MNEKTKDIFRWLAVLPGSIIAGFLITFPLHLLLYLAFANNGTLFGFIELPSGSNVPIEYAIYPFVVAITFIYTGYKIAPKNKFKTAIILFIGYLLTWSIISFVALSQNGFQSINMQFSYRTILALLGATIGLYSAKRSEKLKIN